MIPKGTEYKSLKTLWGSRVSGRHDCFRAGEHRRQPVSNLSKARNCLTVRTKCEKKSLVNSFDKNSFCLSFRSCSVAVITSPCHGEDRGFDSRQDRFVKAKT